MRLQNVREFEVDDEKAEEVEDEVGETQFRVNL